MFKFACFQSTKALLEINQARVNLNVRDPKVGALRQRDVLREANDRLEHHIKTYDHKIKGLMAEVGTLKNEVNR